MIKENRLTGRPFRSEGFVLMVVLALMIFFSTIIQQGITLLMGDSRILLAKKNRIYARELAYSFIPFALASLFKQDQADKEKSEDSGEKKLSELSRFYANLFELSLQTKKVQLTKEADGIDAKIEYRITCEEGKINFNDIYDIGKKEIKDCYKGVLGFFAIAEGNNKILLIDVLKEYFKKNAKNYPVLDVFSIGLRDNLSTIIKLDQIGKGLCIGGLFTTFTPTSKSINPILLSKTITDGLGIEIKGFVGAGEEKDRAEQQKKLYAFCSKIDQSMAMDWKKGLKTLDETLWKSNVSWFLKEEKNVENLVSNLLSTEIEPKFFNVLIRVSFKSVEFSISAIVLREASLADLFKANDFRKKNKDKAEEGSGGKTVLSRQNLYTISGLKILRVYENFQ